MGEKPKDAGSQLSIKALGRTAKKSSRLLKQSEDALQKAVEQYLSLKRIRYIHLPKGAQRYLWNKKFGLPIQVAMEASRALKGVPDLIIFGTDGIYLLIELKSEKGSLTPEQKEWLPYGMEVFRDFDSFQKFIDEWAACHSCNPRLK